MHTRHMRLSSFSSQRRRQFDGDIDWLFVSQTWIEVITTILEPRKLLHPGKIAHKQLLATESDFWVKY